MSGASPTRTNVSDITRRYITDSVFDETERDQGEGLREGETGWKMSHLRREFMQGQMSAVHSRSTDVCGYLKMISNGLSYVTWNITA